MAGIKKSGMTGNKSNAKGMGGRAQQLKNAGVPGGVIGKLARASQTAPGQRFFHNPSGKVGGGKKGK